MKPILLALIFSATAYSEPGVTDKEVLIGACTALTGSNQDVSRDQIAGAKAYFDYVNEEQKGIHGRKIHLTIDDDAYNPEKAIDCFKSQLDHGVFAMAFVDGTPTGAKYVHLSDLNKLPLIGFNSGARFIFDPPKPFSFSVRSSYDDEGAVLVRHLWSETSARRFAVIYEEDAFGASGLESIRDALKKLGTDVVAAASVLRDKPDFGEPMRQLRAAGPEVLVMAMIPPVEAEFLKKSQDAGWHPIFATIAGKDELIAKAGSAAEGVILMQPVPPPTDTGLSGVSLFDRLLKRYEPKAKPTFIGLVSFTEARVIVEALKKAGKELTREGFVNALEGLGDMDVGLSGEFKVHFSKDRHVAFDTVYPTIARGGRLVSLKDWSKLK